MSETLITLIIPSLFQSMTMDSQAVATLRGLTKKQTNQFGGIIRGKGGEEAEKSVFDLFTNLLWSAIISEHFVMIRNFSVIIADHNKSVNKSNTNFSASSPPLLFP